MTSIDDAMKAEADIDYLASLPREVRAQFARIARLITESSYEQNRHAMEVMVTFTGRAAATAEEKFIPGCQMVSAVAMAILAFEQDAHGLDPSMPADDADGDISCARSEQEGA